MPFTRFAENEVLPDGSHPPTNDLFVSRRGRTLVATDHPKAMPVTLTTQDEIVSG